MNPDFESFKSDWVIRASLRELLEVSQALMFIGRQGGNTNSHVWLTRIPNGKRLWIIRERMITAWVAADSESADPDFALPIPDRFISLLVDVAARGGGVDIYGNEVDGTIVGRNGDCYISTDPPKNVKFGEKDMPYLNRIHGLHTQPAVAEVSIKDLQLFSDIVLDIPQGVEWDRGTVSPFAHMVIGNGQIAWTLDWRRFGSVRTTGAIPAQTRSESTFSVYPYPLARFLRSRDEHEEARVHVDPENPGYLFVVGDNWGIRVVCDREELARWNDRLRSCLSSVSVQMDTVEHEQIPEYIQFTFEGNKCFASIHTHADEMSDYIRLTYVCSTNAPQTPDVLQEINALNSALYGSRVVMRDDEVRVITEFPATSLGDFSSHFTAFSHAVNRCNDIAVFLPLFSNID